MIGAPGRAAVVAAGLSLAGLSAGCGDDDGGGEAGIRCGPTEDALATLDRGIGVILQLEFPAEYEEVRSGDVDFDPEAFLAAVDTLRPLEAIDVSEATDALGTVSEALDLYEESGGLAIESLAADDPFAGGEADRLASVVGFVGEFVTPQHAVRLAADLAGCDVPEPRE